LSSREKEGDMENLSEGQLVLLVDIGRKIPLELDAQKRQRVEALLIAGLIQPSHGNDAASAPYALTAKAQRLLAEKAAALPEN
jgi:hypothetical protein